MMTSRIDLENPQDIGVTITVSMKLKEWKELNNCLATGEGCGGNPAWTFRNKLTELITDLEKQCIIKYDGKV